MGLASTISLFLSKALTWFCFLTTWGLWDIRVPSHPWTLFLAKPVFWEHLKSHYLSSFNETENRNWFFRKPCLMRSRINSDFIITLALLNPLEIFSYRRENKKSASLLSCLRCLLALLACVACLLALLACVACLRCQLSLIFPLTEVV